MQQVTYSQPSPQERLIELPTQCPTTRYALTRVDPRSIDEVDTQILALLQQNSQRTHAELASKVGLSSAAVHKRLKRLRGSGPIERYTVLLDRHMLGLDLMCFIEIRFKNNMSPANRESLVGVLAGFSEILECFTVTGDNDAIMKVLVRDQEHLKQFIERLAASQEVIDRARTSLVLDQYKSTTVLPVGSKGSI